MLFSAFSSMALYKLSSEEPPARRIYESLLEGFDGTTQGGKSYDTSPGTRMEAICFVTAMAAARLDARTDDLAEQMDPARAVEGIGLMERQAGIVPSLRATIAQRRAIAVQRFRNPRGAGRVQIEADLRELLGDDFVAYYTVPAGSGAVFPAALGDWPMTLKLPTASRKIVKLVDSVPFIGVPLTVRYSIPILQVRGIEDPTNELDVGEEVIFEVGATGQMDRVTVSAKGLLSGVRTITASFTRPHSAGVLGFTAPIPYWISTQRHNTVVVTAAAANDPEKRRIVNEYLSRTLRAVSTWDVVEGSSTATVAFALGSPSLGRRTLAAVTL